MCHFDTHISMWYSLFLLLNGHNCNLAKCYVLLFMVLCFQPALYNKQLNNYQILTEFFIEYCQSVTVREIWNMLN